MGFNPSIPHTPIAIFSHTTLIPNMCYIYIIEVINTGVCRNILLGNNSTFFSEVSFIHFALYEFPFDDWIRISHLENGKCMIIYTWDWLFSDIWTHSLSYIMLPEIRNALPSLYINIRPVLTRLLCHVRLWHTPHLAMKGGWSEKADSHLNDLLGNIYTYSFMFLWLV